MKRKKMQIPAMTEQQWSDREKAKIFEGLREHFAFRAILGKSPYIWNKDFFICAIKILQEEIRGGE